MTSRFLMAVLFAVFVLGCASQPPVPEPPPLPPDPCSLPTGYRLDPPTLDVARNTLTNCPEKLDEVFQALLAIGKHKPCEENMTAITDLFKELATANKISERYSKSLLKKYFSRTFDSMPDIKVVNLPAQVEAIKRDLRAELRLKEEGILECCGMRDKYQAADRECGRIFVLLDNLVMNEEYTGM